MPEGLAYGVSLPWQGDAHSGGEKDGKAVSDVIYLKKMTNK
ncbi:hypothetical protein ACVV4J_20155 [Escherichia coli]